MLWYENLISCMCFLPYVYSILILSQPKMILVNHQGACQPEIIIDDSHLPNYLKSMIHFRLWPAVDFHPWKLVQNHLVFFFFRYTGPLSGVLSYHDVVLRQIVDRNVLQQSHSLSNSNYTTGTIWLLCFLFNSVHARCTNNRQIYLFNVIRNVS